MIAYSIHSVNTLHHVLCTINIYIILYTIFSHYVYIAHTQYYTGEMLMVNIGSTSTGGKVVKVLEGSNNEPIARIILTQPVCTQENEKIALSRRVEKHWRLIGWGEIRKGNRIEMNKTFKVADVAGGGGGGAEDLS